MEVLDELGIVMLVLEVETDSRLENSDELAEAAGRVGSNNEAFKTLHP